MRGFGDPRGVGPPDVFRVERCGQLGISRSRLYAHISGRRWQRPTPVAVVTHNGPLTLRQQRLAAVLTAGSRWSPAALAAWTSLEHDGLLRWSRPETHVLIPRGRTPTDFGTLAVVVHESRRFGPADVGHLADVPRTSVTRSAIDAAIWSGSDRAACGVLAAVVQQRLTSASRLRAELFGAGRVRRRRLLLAVLTDIEGGAQAVSELDFLAFCRRHHLGRPSQQRVRHDASGRRRYLDATFVSRSGREVHIEIDGAIHLTAESQWSDMVRGNDLALVGAYAFRFPSSMIHSDDPAAVRQLRAAVDR